MKFFIFGAGFSASAFARHCDAPVYGTTRSKEKFAQLRQNHIEPLLFNAAIDTASLSKPLSETTHLIISIAPDEYGDPVLRMPLLLNHMPKLEWISYLSTVGVYGGHQGAWVDEQAQCRPSLGRNQKRLEAEKEWQNFADQCNVPLAILRLAGIYGPSRNAFVKLQEGKTHCIIKPGQVFNRIHVDDIAGSLQFLAKNKQGGIFNISDDKPAPPQDVLAYAARLMNIAPPTEIPFDKAELSPVQRAFYGDNKRIANKKLKHAGYHLLFPDYENALDNMWRNNNWR